MNNRLNKLAEKSGFKLDELPDEVIIPLEAFAESLIRECAKEMKCYDPYKGTCVFCFNLQSCENMYGCGDKKPIDPTTNYCSKCWPEITY